MADRYINFQENKSMTTSNGEKIWMSELHLQGEVKPTQGLFFFGVDFQTPGS
jgi:hypothetical protein